MPNTTTVRDAAITFRSYDGDTTIATRRVPLDQGQLLLEFVGFDPTDFGMDIHLSGADMAARATKVLDGLRLFHRNLPDLEKHLSDLIALGKAAERAGHQITWGR